MSQIAEIIADIRQVETTDDANKFGSKYRKFDGVLDDVNDSHWEGVRDLLIACVECGTEKVLKLAIIVLSKRKLVQWKSHPEIFNKMLDTMIVCGKRAASEKPRFWRVRDYYDLMESLITLLKSLQLLKTFGDKYYEIIQTALGSKENRAQCLVRQLEDYIPWTKHVDWMKKVMERTYDIIQEYPELLYEDTLGNAIYCLWRSLFSSVYSGKPEEVRTAVGVVGVVTKVFKHCAQAEWLDPEDPEKKTTNFELCKQILESFLIPHRDRSELVQPMFSTVQMLRDCDDEILARDAKNLLNMMGANITEIMGDNMDPLVEEFLEDPYEKFSQLNEAFNASPKKFEKRVNDMANAILDCEEEDMLSGGGISFLWDMAKEYPKAFSKEVLSKLAEVVERMDAFPFCVMILDTLAPTRKADLLPYHDVVITCLTAMQGMWFCGGDFFLNISMLGKKHAVKSMAALYDLAKLAEDTTASQYIYYMYSIGSNHPKELGAYKSYFEECLKNPKLKQYAEQALDIIAGRSLKKVSEDVAEQKEEILQIDERVTETEQRVDDVEEDVKRIDKNVDEVKADVAEQGERLDELEEVVEETVEKVEEIDKKTLSHAPVWSRDVAKLMNPEAEYDWRYLATRLGYSNDDIRNWATQPDPCLSLLDEWFATHKTRDATFAVEQALNEMNRVDAAMIVENALKQTEGVVEEDDTEEWDPPPIFISYQWGHQQEVKLLHKHLGMAGYNSWMDIGQMGGGDKLFAKIDQGIRAAKVVICCVSEKYAKSANCNREVNLSVTLGKPMIPLLMEKLDWPPPGSMGPIFGEYIFVRFFARPGETAGDERYWPTAKFQELLMQIRFTHAPDPSIIDSDLYKNWWNPPEEIIVIKPKESKEKAASNKAEDKEGDGESPEVFISYQWGKQPQIKKLYSTLTSRGYMCWLDIMQMGGGDSLYDKIDKGIRGCKVVVSCVTSKYALSANCRREVSLADALKKPIVPLLLEQTTWPPAGPMSMVFTQLLYIDFCKPNVEVQNSWTCPQMNDLYNKLMAHVPRMKPLEDASDKMEADRSPSKVTTAQEPQSKDRSESKNSTDEKQSEPAEVAERQQDPPKGMPKQADPETQAMQSPAKELPAKKPQAMEPPTKEPPAKSSSCRLL